jgi:hypothetical protein
MVGCSECVGGFINSGIFLTSLVRIKAFHPEVY